MPLMRLRSCKQAKGVVPQWGTGLSVFLYIFHQYELVDLHEHGHIWIRCIYEGVMESRE